MITRARQVEGSSLLKMEPCTTSGAKSDTSFFNEETLGETYFEFNFALDLKELAFWSCDPVFDRPAFNEDDWCEIKKS